ncbi:MAG: mechanosensitive ion channel family protein [Steroidobacteraceae bacterium]
MLPPKRFDSYQTLAVHAGIIAAASVLLALLLRALGRRLIAHAARHTEPMREALYRSTLSPLAVLILLGGAYIIAVLINQRIHAQALARALGPSLQAAVIVVVAWGVWNLLEVYPRLRSPRAHELDPMIYDLIGKAARLGLLALTALMVLRALHFPISSLLTVGGVAGIAIGFAAQGVVSNVFGAMVVYLDKPFKIGEWITLPAMNISGTVEHIGWRSTRVRGFDTSPYYVPNYLFNTQVVETPPRMQARRIQQTIPVRYADIDRLPAILQELRAYLSRHPGIDHHQSQMVNFINYGTHTLDIMIYCFAGTVQWGESLDVQEDVLLNAAQIIAKHGAELALPITRVQMQAPESDAAAHDAVPKSVPTD